MKGIVTAWKFSWGQQGQTCLLFWATWTRSWNIRQCFHECDPIVGIQLVSLAKPLEVSTWIKTS